MRGKTFPAKLNEFTIHDLFFRRLFVHCSWLMAHGSCPRDDPGPAGLQPGWEVPSLEPDSSQNPFLAMMHEAWATGVSRVVQLGLKRMLQTKTYDWKNRDSHKLCTYLLINISLVHQNVQFPKSEQSSCLCFYGLVTSWTSTVDFHTSLLFPSSPHHLWFEFRWFRPTVLQKNK